MSEFVKKTIMGYKTLDGGHSDPECTHVILPVKEYDDLLREISQQNKKDHGGKKQNKPVHGP